MSYIVNHFADGPPSCLPEHLDRKKSQLVDITAIGDSWRKYLDPATGTIHDGAEYFAQSNRAGVAESCPEVKYQLVRAEFICPICDKGIQPGEPYAKIEEIEKGLLHTRFAHQKCIDGLVGKP